MTARPDGPRTAGRSPHVGQRVFDTGTQRRAVVTDILRRGLPRPVYVLRHDGPPNSWTWETDRPARFRPADWPPGEP